MKKTRVFWGLAIFLILLSACFSHTRQSLSVIGYRDGRVFLKKNNYYRVGELPLKWHEFSANVKAVSFYNKELGATISTDAFCAGSFEDLPLKTLSGQLFAGIGQRKILQEKEIILDGRAVLRTLSSGTMDGVAIKFDSVVLKKNNCTIDFIYIVPPQNYEAGIKDFELFYNGFKF